MRTIIFLAAALFSTVSLGFASGDKIECLDDVSSATYTIKIVDEGDLEAYVKVKYSNPMNGEDSFFPAHRVIFRNYRYDGVVGSIFHLMNKEGTEFVGELDIPLSPDGNRTTLGYFADQGDSRGIECKLLNKQPSVELQQLEDGDKIECYDGVSNNTYTIKILDIYDEDAYIRVQGPNGEFFHPASKVNMTRDNEGMTLSVFADDYSKFIESIDLPYTFTPNTEFSGTYSDHGDSRNLKCSVL